MCRHFRLRGRSRSPADLLERNRRMASIAGPPERALVHVVPAMTPIAVRAQRNRGHIPGNVASLAIEAAVRSCQRVARLCVVIKAPPRPTIWIVAERAVRPQATVMMTVRVARNTGRRRTFELQ